MNPDPTYTRNFSPIPRARYTWQTLKGDITNKSTPLFAMLSVILTRTVIHWSPADLCIDTEKGAVSCERWDRHNISLACVWKCRSGWGWVAPRIVCLWTLLCPFFSLLFCPWYEDWHTLRKWIDMLANMYNFFSHMYTCMQICTAGICSRMYLCIFVSFRKSL